MSAPLRLIAAMSGGVDSAVAAARAKEAGHDVTGVHLALAAKAGEIPGGRAKGCCTLADVHDARRAADVIGIPFFVWDMAEEFAEAVMDDFISEYSVGRTPNPCLRCNERIKFAAVLQRAMDLGYDGVVTGHYAQVDRHDGRATLRRAVDSAKDQSYVLAVMEPEQLDHAYFPLGDTVKPDVRREAKERGLFVANKPDSHDICFIPDGDTAGFLRKKLGSQPGPIVDARSGEQVGEHDGAWAFTVGQRRGVGLGRPAADGQPRYVVEVDPESSTVMVGPPTLLDVDVITGGAPVWLGPAPQVGDECAVQIRAHGQPVAAVITQCDSHQVRVHTDEPIRAVAAGQTMVLYDGDRVLGSTTINSSARLARDEQVSVADV